MIYLIGELPRIGPVKIGYSSAPTLRLGELQGRGNATITPSSVRRSSLALIDSLSGGLPIEQAIHAMLSDRRLTGEWFDLGWHQSMIVARFRWAHTEVTSIMRRYV